MGRPLETLELELMQLTAADRASLLERLVASLDTDPELEAAWAQEADRREAALAEGLASEVDGEAAVKRLRARLGL